MPLWAILALSGGGMGILQGQEAREQARNKQLVDLAQARTSGFTGKAPTYTAQPSVMGHALQGAFTGGIMGLQMDNKAAADKAEADKAAQADTWDQNAAAQDELGKASAANQAFQQAPMPSLYQRLAKKPYGVGFDDAY